VPLRIAHPGWMLAFLVLTSVTFSLLGFIIGIWADGLREAADRAAPDHLAADFLGGSFYSISVLPPAWQTVTLLQSGGLPDQRIPLELLRGRRRERGGEPGDDGPVPGGLPRVVWWIFKDRVSAQELRLGIRPGGRGGSRCVRRHQPQPRIPSGVPS